jgi:hypothetical protein
VPEEGAADGDEGSAHQQQQQGEEASDPLPSAWDPSDWWGEDEEAAARQCHNPPRSALDHEALSSRRPPPNPQPAPLPRPWDPEGSGPYHASLSADRLTARYVGKGANHPQDVGTIKADRPLPRTRDCYYFEVGGPVRLAWARVLDVCMCACMTVAESTRRSVSTDPVAD